MQAWRRRTGFQGPRERQAEEIPSRSSPEGHNGSTGQRS